MCALAAAHVSHNPGIVAQSLVAPIEGLTVTITRDNFGSIQFSDGVKTVTFNESKAGGLDRLWDVLDVTS